MKRLRTAFRGLTIGLSISVVNLAGMFLTIIAIGGLGDWSGRQFLGVFGVFEIGTGFAFILCPNVWRMPVIESETSSRTDVQLAASTVFIPHWAGGAKSLAGLAMVIYAGMGEGFGPVTILLLPFTLLTGVFVIAVSAAAARWGVAHPGLDVYKLIIRRPGRKELSLPAISLTASFLQIILEAFTLPMIKLMPPSTIYRPEIGPSPGLLLGFLAATVASVALMAWSWRGRISWQAPREQQRKAETPT